MKLNTGQKSWNINADKLKKAVEAVGKPAEDVRESLKK